jgi:pilus assembly protein CpaB
MNRLPLRSLLFGGTALLLGAATLYFGQAALRAQNQRTVAAPRTAANVLARNILVAGKPLVSGQRIVVGDLIWRTWPTAGVDPAHIVEGSRPISAFTDSIVRADILAGEPVTATRLAVPGYRGALAAVMGPGLRAVSVALTPTSGVSGLIAPGDHVDVVLTYALPHPEGATGNFERHAATTVLSNLRVLAIDQRLSGTAIVPPPGTANVEVRNASLEVTVKQSEALALAADLGKLSLSLRGIDPVGDGTSDAAAGSTIDYQVGRLLPGLPRANARAAVARPSAAAPTVAQFHGSKPDVAGSSQ